jgi:hypothetical protein
MTIGDCMMICSQCKNEIIDKEIDKQNWAVVKVTDLKMRPFGVLGFPYGGDVTVRGWQLEKAAEFSTQICSGCIANHLAELEDNAQRHKERFSRRQKFLTKFGPLTGGVLGTGLLAAWLLDPHFSMFNGWYLFLLCAAGIMALLPVFNFFLDAPSKNEITFSEASIALHNACFEQAKTEVEKKLDNKILSLILHPEPRMPGPIPHKGLLFTVPESDISKYENHKNNTGWSRIDYYAKFGPNPVGPYDAELQKENLKNIGIDHWGEFLSLPASNFTSVSRFSEIHD